VELTELTCTDKPDSRVAATVEGRGRAATSAIDEGSLPDEAGGAELTMEPAVMVDKFGSSQPPVSDDVLILHPLNNIRSLVSWDCPRGDIVHFRCLTFSLSAQPGCSDVPAFGIVETRLCHLRDLHDHSEAPNSEPL
jgi:hypothetical protein